MAVYQTEAVVLGAKNWGEADKMVTLFTRDRGLLTAAAFGCRRPRSPLASTMQMFSLVDLQLSEGRRVDTVKQASLVQHYRKLSEDFSVLAYGSLVAEVLREFLPEGQPEPKLFELILSVLAAFETRNPRVTAVAAIYQLMEFTGLQLHYEHCVHCGKRIDGDAYFLLHEGGVLCKECREAGAQIFPEELRLFILSLRDLDWKKSEGMKIRGKLLVQAEQLLLTHLQQLMGRQLQSLVFLQSL